MTQLTLNFNDLPIPEPHLWDQFDDEQKRLLVETLARLLIQVTHDQNQEPTND